MKIGDIIILTEDLSLIGPDNFSKNTFFKKGSRFSYQSSGHILHIRSIETNEHFYASNNTKQFIKIEEYREDKLNDLGI